MPATLSLRDCGWCAEPIPAEALRCVRCGERAGCPQHPMELIQGRCESCGRPVCRRCLEGKRCGDCPQPAPVIKPVEPGRPADLIDPIDASRWPFHSPDWVSKFLLGALLILLSPLLVPVYLLMGYQIRISHQQHADPRDQPMPPFVGLGNLLVLGAKHAMALALPVLASILAIAAPFGFVILSAGGPARATVAVLLTITLYVWALFLSLAYPLVMPAIEVEHLRTGSVWVGFRPRALWQQMARRPQDYLLLTIYYWILGTLAAAGFVACGVGILLTAPWGAYATGCLLGRYLAHQDEHDRVERELVEALLAADPSRRPTPQPDPTDPAESAEVGEDPAEGPAPTDSVPG